MKALIFAFISSVLSMDSFEAGSCPAVKCASPTANLGENVCIDPKSSDEILIRECLDSSKPFCPAIINPRRAVECTDQPSTEGLGYPGEKCTTDSDCKSNTCSTKQKICEGVAKDQECNANSECNPGLYCSLGTCLPLIEQGGTGCKSQFECVSSCACLKVDNENTCVKYFTQPNDAIVSTCNTELGISMVCESGYCETSGFPSKGTCKSAPTSGGKTLPVKCSSKSDCTGTQGKDKDSVSGTCTCGYNAQGNAYCDAFIGDSPGLTFISTLRQIVNRNGFGDCNTERRFSIDCWTKVDGGLYEQAAIAYYNFVEYPQLIGHELCVEEIYYPGVFGGALELCVAAVLILFA